MVGAAPITKAPQKKTTPQLIKEITERIKVIKENGRTELLLKLKPENLGEIFISITKTGDNVSINIFAKENTKELLENDLAELEKALKNSHLNIGDLQVSVNDKKKEAFTEDEPQYLSIPTNQTMLYNIEQSSTALIDSFSIERALGIDHLQNIYSNA